MSMRKMLISNAIVATASIVGSVSLIASTPAKDPVAAAREEIFTKELGIYADRGKGQLDFYVANASPKYLGWPPTVSAPIPLTTLRQNSGAMRGQTNEKIDTALKGFTLSGSTAVIYYSNHRTKKADGTPVDQTFENIHVWTKEEGRWKLLGGLARMVKG